LSTVLPSALCNSSFYFSMVDDGPYRFNPANSPGCCSTCAPQQATPSAWKRLKLPPAISMERTST